MLYNIDLFYSFIYCCCCFVLFFVLLCFYSLMLLLVYNFQERQKDTKVATRHNVILNSQQVADELFMSSCTQLFYLLPKTIYSCRKGYLFYCSCLSIEQSAFHQIFWGGKLILFLSCHFLTRLFLSDNK